MRISPSKGVQKCPICLLTKAEAIREHVLHDSFCFEPTCPFKEEIANAVNITRAKEKCPFTIHPKIKY